MRNDTEETAVAVSLEEFTRVCDEVDAQCAAVYSGVFAQWRTAAKAASYVEALGRDDVPVKTCWDLAQATGYELAKPFQSLVGTNTWDHRQLWARIAGLASATLTCAVGDLLGPGIALDETAQAKRGRHTAGVGVQYAGFAGGKVNCVTSVVLSLVTPDASTWVANELFLQAKQWFTGRGGKGTARRRGAGIGREVVFESKPQIARRMLGELRSLGVGFAWAAGDEVYGRCSQLRREHEDHGEAYAYFVPRSFHVQVPSGARLRADELRTHAQGRFETRSCGPGLNGPRWYEWAMIATASPEHFLLVRQAADHHETGPDTPDTPGADHAPHRSAGSPAPNPRTTKLPPGTGFMYCHVPVNSPIAATLPSLLAMIGRRWPVEETIAIGKGPIGWDENQFRTYTSVQRHAALCGMAMLKATMVRTRLDHLDQAAPPPADATDGPARPEPTPQAIPEPATTGRNRPTTNRPPPPAKVDHDCPIPTGDAPLPHRADQECPPDIGCIRLSLAETLRLINIARSQISQAGKQFLLRWSVRRRRHQAIARWHHRRTRIAATSAGP